jgi:archaea-specific DNA-binding protein
MRSPRARGTRGTANRGYSGESRSRLSANLPSRINSQSTGKIPVTGHNERTTRKHGARGQQTCDERILRNSSGPISYVLACLTLFQNGSTEVSIKARGRAISTAVDAAEILTKRFLPDARVNKIEIGTEQVKSPETGTVSNVSSMEIHVSR